MADNSTTTTTTTTSTIRPVSRSKRRNVPEMRSETLALGGVFLDWSERLADAPGNAAHRQAWKTVSDKGFQVFVNGCILPHPYYRRKGDDGPARVRGPKASMECFHGPAVLQPEEGGRNEDGWPTQPEITHFCHWKSCVNPEHMAWEPRWKNWKRNYCRGCDCNADADAPCLAMFHPSSWWENEANWPAMMSYSDNHGVKWSSVLPKGVRLLPKEHFQAEDQKAGNRASRKRKHNKQVKKSNKRRRIQ